MHVLVWNVKMLGAFSGQGSASAFGVVQSSPKWSTYDKLYILDTYMDPYSSSCTTPCMGRVLVPMQP